MNAESDYDEKARAYIRLLQDPYAKLSILGDPDDEPSFPLGKPAERGVLPLNSRAPVSVAQHSDRTTTKQEFEKLFDNVLSLYKPYVARSEWSRVEDYRSLFLADANAAPVVRSRVAQRLEKLVFVLAPGEKVEHNRAPAQRIIAELKRLLDESR